MNETKKYKILKYFTLATLIILLATIASILGYVKNPVILPFVLIAVVFVFVDISILFSLGMDKLNEPKKKLPNKIDHNEGCFGDCHDCDDENCPAMPDERIKELEINRRRKLENGKNK